MRVCLFTDSADPSGMGEHMLTLAQELRAQTEVVLLFAGTPAGGAFVERAKAVGFIAHGLEIHDWTVERDLRRRLSSIRPDLVHAHAGVQWEGLWIGHAVRQACQAPVVRTEHLPYLLTKPVDEAEHSAALPSFAAVICVSEGARAGHLGRDPLGRTPTLVRNGVAVRPPSLTREAMRARLGVDSDARVLLTVARLFKQKGHAVLLQALQILDRPEVLSLIVGEGELAGPLERAVRKMRLDGRVRLLGRREDVPDLLAAADLFVLPSLFEGHPLSVLEALHAGLPVIATAVPGTTEAVTHNVEALLVPPGEPGALAASIARALDDPAATRPRAEAARVRAAAEFGAERMARETLAVYREVVAREGRRSEVAWANCA